MKFKNFHFSLDAVLSVRFEVGVSLLLAPARADKRGRRPVVLWGGIWACPPENF